jgi:hypothetical protein
MDGTLFMSSPIWSNCANIQFGFDFLLRETVACTLMTIADTLQGLEVAVASPPRAGLNGRRPLSDNDR